MGLMATAKERWDIIFKAGKDFVPLNELFLDRILKRVRALRADRGVRSRPKTVVEFGAGTGDAAVKLARRGFLVQAIDWSEVALRKAAAAARRGGVADRITLTPMDLERIDETQLIHRPTDIVFSKLTVAFIRNKKKFLEHSRRILRRTGVFILITPVRYRHIRYVKRDQPDIALPWDGTLRLLRRTFRKVEVFHHDYFGNRGDQITFLAMK